MKTKEQILEEWLSKDGMGINYTSEQRILLAMEEYAEHFKYDFSKGCECESRIGKTWCCNYCGLPTTQDDA